MVRKEDYGAEVPDGVIVLTAGVDTQDNRLEVEIIGWGRNFENWRILKKILIGDPRHNVAVWEDLDRILLSPYTKASGEQLFVACTLQDAMGHCTDEVYKFTAPRASRRVFACKGRGKTGVPMTMPPKKTEIGQKYNAYLVTVGVDTIKDQLFSWMKVEQPGSVGYMHFPDLPEYDQEHFLQLTSEKLVSRMVNGSMVYSYKKTRERNEALDLFVYNRAALNLLRLDLNKMADNKQKVTWNPMRNIPNSPTHQANRMRVLSKGVQV
jgi:phage terminase large subunit GpA-like protein